MYIRKSLQIGLLFGAIFTAGYLLADDDEHEYAGSKSLVPVSHPKWQAECASCHML